MKEAFIGAFLGGIAAVLIQSCTRVHADSSEPVCRYSKEQDLTMCDWIDGETKYAMLNQPFKDWPSVTFKIKTKVAGEFHYEMRITGWPEWFPIFGRRLVQRMNYPKDAFKEQ